jgi:hypothetical protein
MKRYRSKVAASEGKGERALVLVPQDNTHFCRTYTLLMLACMYPRRSIQPSRPAFEGKSSTHTAAVLWSYPSQKVSGAKKCKSTTTTDKGSSNMLDKYLCIKIVDVFLPFRLYFSSLFPPFRLSL